MMLSKKDRYMTSSPRVVKVFGPQWTVDRFYLTFEGPGIYKIYSFGKNNLERVLCKIEKQFGDFEFKKGPNIMAQKEFFELVRTLVNHFGPKVTHELPLYP